MDLYHLWFDLKPGVGDLELCEAVDAFLGQMRDNGRIGGYRISRRKLGLGPPDLGEFHVEIQVADLAQLDAAFGAAARRADPVEELHHQVNSKVSGLRAALYREFPDPVRERGRERF